MADHPSDRIRALADEGVFPKEIASMVGMPRSSVLAVLRSIRPDTRTTNDTFDYAAFRELVAERRRQFEQDWLDNARYIAAFLETWKEKPSKKTPGRMLARYT